MSLQRPDRLEMFDMPITQKFHKWHFLLVGSLLILLSGLLWYWNWRIQGIPMTLVPEHYIAAASFIVGIFVLGVFIYILNRQQVTIMLVGVILVNLVAALGTLWINRNTLVFFDLIRPADLAVYDQAYIRDWQRFFITPALFALHAGFLLLWGESLLMFLVRKPTDDFD